nr:hypothetical protein [Nitrospirota bacterium]
MQIDKRLKLRIQLRLIADMKDGRRTGTDDGEYRNTSLRVVSRREESEGPDHANAEERKFYQWRLAATQLERGRHASAHQGNAHWKVFSARIKFDKTMNSARLNRRLKEKQTLEAK